MTPGQAGLPNPQTGTVVSLHIHPKKSGEPLLPCEVLHLVAARGIEEDSRYFGRVSRRTGQPSRRQVSLIERELIARHAASLGLPALPPGVVRANFETSGFELQSCIGRDVEVGEALLHFYEPRVPCQKMDVICLGLRALMENGHQGVMAEVIRSGVVKVGDAIRVMG